ncbi:hypothetical protein HZS_2867 [Henneguya salminicola]|nr:hypothetical protein HZS_2867 [Henneguya salminicola]
MYICCLFIFYSLMPVTISNIGATGMNISLFTADVCAIIYNTIHKQSLSIYFWISIAIAIFGNFIYHAQSIYNNMKSISSPTKSIEKVGC